MTAPVLVLAALMAGPLRAAPSYPEMRADPRFELLGMVQLLAGADTRYSAFQRHDIPYQRAAQAHFAPHKGHEAVRRYSALTDKGFDYLMAYQFVFALSDPPELALREQLPAPLVERMGGAAAAEEFRLLLADFSKASGFPGFYARMEPRLSVLLEDVRAQARRIDTKGVLERYLGAPIGIRYEFILSTFAEPVLVTTFQRTDPDGVPRLTSLYGPEDQEGKFGFLFESRIGPIWWELTLARLTTQAERHRARLERSAALYAPLGGSCAPSWYDCAQRHIAFAVGARLLERRGAVEMAREWPVKYARIGLPYLAPLIEKLKTYEADRARYPTLDSFYPALLETFEELAEGERKALAYYGRIDEVLASPGKFLIIAPDGDGPAGGWKAGVERFRQKRWPEAEVLSGEQALEADLAGRNLVVIGTRETNPWLARRYADLNLPVRVESGKISLTRVFGELRTYDFRGRVGLITTALNPSDPSRPVLVYTAADPGALAGTLDAYDGAADYVILEEGRLLKVGLYEKSRVPWRVK
ncbi:MAG: DUF4932 domain-containing protein [Elusimicrobiota bacterium]|nr:DUF4932 domain-containing protein [Elusimicrobiota bacterium]